MRQVAFLIGSTVCLFIGAIGNSSFLAAEGPPKQDGQRLHNLSHLKPPVKPDGYSTTTSPQVVMLTTHELDPATRGPGILQREVARQAFLLAARDELGLGTRDKSLRETFPHEENPTVLPFDMLVSFQADQRALVTVFRQAGGKYDVLWQKELKLAADGTFEDLVSQCETLSRTDFVAILEQGGYRRTERPGPSARDDGADEDSEPIEFNMIAQFAAARDLHGQLQKHGDAPRRLASLARVYAELGAETAFYWSPMHKVFEARALLYAERLVQKTAASPAALWNRAYVRALVGRHQAALDDLQRAAKAGAVKPGPPDWVEVISAYCEFNQPRLMEFAEQKRLRALVYYLHMLQQEFAEDSLAKLRTIAEVLELSPDSFRAMDLAKNHRLQSVRIVAGEEAYLRFPAHLYRRLNGLAGLPEGAAKLCQHEIENGESQNPRDEVKARVELVAALDQAARTPSRSGEPSWGVVAAFIREAGFLHSWLKIALDKRSGGEGTANATFNDLAPLFRSHPYAALIPAPQDAAEQDQANRAPTMMDLRKSIDTSELELIEFLILVQLGPTGRSPPETDHVTLVFNRCDPIYRDLTGVALRKVNQHPEQQRGELRVVSPSAPVIVVEDIVSAISAGTRPGTVEKIALWERNYTDDPMVLQALSALYTRLKRDDDALRITKREAEVNPKLETYRRLAQLYKQRGDIDRWKATLDEFLEGENIAFEHSAVQIEIADHFMALKEWDKAVPYVTAAAQTWTGNSLLAAHRCYDGMQDWDNAELYISRFAEEYRENAYEWYFWCKRSGHGDVEAAREAAAECIRTLIDPRKPGRAPIIATFQQLSGDAAAALQTWSAEFEKTNDPIPGLCAALIAHNLGKAGVRDNLLERVETRGKEFRFQNRAREELIAFAGLLRRQIAAGRKARFDEPKFADILKTAPAAEATALYYYAGEFLLREGQTAPARKYLQQAAGGARRALLPALAAARLIDKNVEIGGAPEKK
jgi:tetratricopeptide (TPR) repeat protein